MTRLQKIQSLKQEILDYKPSRLSQEDIEDVSDNYQAHLEYSYWYDEQQDHIKALEEMTDEQFDLEQQAVQNSIDKPELEDCNNGYYYIDSNGNKAWTEDYEQSIGE